MTNVFVRIHDVIAANLNDLLDRVEDPERMIKQIIREMEENIGHAKEGVIDALASEKRLKKELENHREQAREWFQRAERALGTENESLAREALARKREHERIAESMEQSWESARNTTARLKSQLQALEDKLDEAKRKKGSLIARKRMVQARDHMDRTLSRMDSVRDMSTSFGRMEDKVLDMEARIEAREEIHDPHSDLEREFLEMEVDSEVEADLDALKRKLAGGGD